EKLTIGEAAQLLGVSIDTLRRWDKKGKLSAWISPGGHRYYPKIELEAYRHDIFAIAGEWVLGAPNEPESKYYCPTSVDFKGRLSKLQQELEKEKELKKQYSLIVAVAGEIGNNSFDHNLGNWPDIPGAFFAHNINKRQLALADRGRGVLKTIKNIKPEVKNYEEALKTAFTEVISGRSPEARGNGLKFVLEIAINSPMKIEFYSGDAKASISKKLLISRVDTYYSGCLALVSY
ncbi:MAG: helix-turn-helix domain-containing protein, partial [bacterium]